MTATVVIHVSCLPTLVDSVLLYMYYTDAENSISMLLKNSNVLSFEKKKKKWSSEYQEYFLSLLCPGAKLLACSTVKPLLSDQTMTPINHMMSRTKKIKNSFSCELSLRASWLVSQGCRVLFLSLTGLSLSSGAFTVYGSAEKWLGILHL